jgi:hypothetical protein
MGRRAGKWIPEEAAKLMKAVKKYGKEWSQLLRWFPVERIHNVVIVGKTV